MQRVSYQLLHELERKKSVRVIKDTINASGKGWVSLDTFWFLLKNLTFLPSKVKKCQADIIVFSSMVTASLAIFIRRRVSVPMVTINHGRDVTLPNPFYQKIVPKIFGSLDGVVSVSNATQSESIKRGMDASKGIVLPNGLDLNKFKELPDKDFSRDELQKEFQIPLSDKKMLLSVGRKVKRKGHEWFLRNVLPKVKSEVVYITVGDGPEIEGIKQAIEDENLHDKVFLLGKQPDDMLKKAYAASDLFIMPNIPVEGDMEGFGIVLLEANWAGTPAVASDLEGIKDVITNGENGFKIPALDDISFAQKIDEVLNKDLHDFSERTKEFVVKKFAWTNVSEMYLRFFKRVLKSAEN